MKKIILAVILVAAVGGAAYYLLQNKKQNAVSNFQQKQIIGKWKVDSVSKGKDFAEFLAGYPDSNLIEYDYDFQKENIVIKFLRDSALKDTIRYQWAKDNRLIWKGQDDSAGHSLTITTLNKDSLVLQTKESAMIYFKKAK